MPSSVIDFQVSDPCAGGGHATITMRKDGSPIGSRRVGVAELKLLAEGMDPKGALWDVALEMLRLADPSSIAEAKTVVNNMTITVEF